MLLNDGFNLVLFIFGREFSFAVDADSDEI